MSNTNKFYNNEKYRIELFSDKGTITQTYRVGDSFPMSCIGITFDTIWSYGQNYNIFPYKSDEYILLIRNGVFRDAIHYTDLKDDYVFGVSCYNSNGEKLDVKYVKDYINLIKNSNTDLKDNPTLDTNDSNSNRAGLDKYINDYIKLITK